MTVEVLNHLQNDSVHLRTYDYSSTSLNVHLDNGTLTSSLCLSQSKLIEDIYLFQTIY